MIILVTMAAIVMVEGGDDVFGDVGFERDGGRR